MKKFICGFLVGAILCTVIGVFAVSYVAETVNFKILVNGEEFKSEKPALAVDGSTYLPLKAIGDALGVPVVWNNELRQVEVGISAPVANKTEYSRNNPAPIGTIQTYTSSNAYFEEDNYSVSVRVMETVRGEEAYKALKKQGMVYPEPEDGYEYLNAKIALSVLSTKGDFSVDLYQGNFSTFTSNNEECPYNYYTSIDPQFTGSLYEGGNAEGWITVMVKKDDAHPKLAYGLDYNGSGGIWFTLAK